MTLQEIWNRDAPEGYCWQCPDCQNWATLGGNAGFHSQKENHRLPELVLIPTGAIEKAKCTLCCKVESSGFFTGCMIRDVLKEAGVNFNGWECDGEGNLTRTLTAAKNELV